MTTPFEREILIHHYTCSDPFPRPTDLYWATVNRFTDMGLLIRKNMDERVYPNNDALAVYFDALAKVPLPERVWRLPDTPSDQQVSSHTKDSK